MTTRTPVCDTAPLGTFNPIPAISLCRVSEHANTIRPITYQVMIASGAYLINGERQGPRRPSSSALPLNLPLSNFEVDVGDKPVTARC